MALKLGTSATCSRPARLAPQPPATCSRPACSIPRWSSGCLKGLVPIALGAAYGAIEMMFILLQTTIVFLLGVVRMSNGYPGALGLLCGFFASVMVISLPVTMHSRDYRPAGPMYICHVPSY